MPSCFGWSSPHPRFGSSIELCCGYAHCLLDLISIGKTLSSERITAEEAPPALLQIQPAGSFGNEHVLDARMGHKRGARLQAVMTAQIVRDKEEVPQRIVRFDVLEELNIVLGITCSGTSGQLLAIANPQGAIDPDLLLATTVIQGSFDAVSIG
jgi:hypothetical protein